MIPRLEDLIWDSNFFNKKIGRVFLDTIEECQLLNYLEQDNVKKFDLIYIYSPNILPAFSAYLVEVKVVYEGKVTCDNVSVEECNCSQYNDKIITPELERLAWKSAVYSRFKVDSKFGEQYKRLYSSWMKKSLSGVIADCVFCHKTNSEVDGMVTVRKKDNVGEIGLIAVDSKIRTKGIGTALVNSVKLWLQQQDINQLEVTTQQANRQACNFFEKQGLTQQTVTYIYHYWL